ncbi:MAG: hypothetical protein V7K50_20910 [Nostoc sp.]|uniref:hypothetical protein n=1 Tax=Nostoc sp. TaxID=1180 RepID=UPI002FF7621F
MSNYRTMFVLAVLAGTGFAYGFYTTGWKIKPFAPSELCRYRNGEYETLQLKTSSITDARSILGNIPEDSSTGKIKIFVWDNGSGCRKIQLEFLDNRLIAKKRLPLPKDS